MWLLKISKKLKIATQNFNSIFWWLCTNVLFLSMLCCSQNGDDPQEDLAKSDSNPWPCWLYTYSQPRKKDTIYYIGNHPKKKGRSVRPWPWLNTWCSARAWPKLPVSTCPILPELLVRVPAQGPRNTTTEQEERLSVIAKDLWIWSWQSSVLTTRKDLVFPRSLLRTLARCSAWLGLVLLLLLPCFLCFFFFCYFASLLSVHACPSSSLLLSVPYLWTGLSVCVQFVDKNLQIQFGFPQVVYHLCKEKKLMCFYWICLFVCLLCALRLTD